MSALVVKHLISILMLVYSFQFLLAKEEGCMRAHQFTMKGHIIGVAQAETISEARLKAMADISIQLSAQIDIKQIINEDQFETQIHSDLELSSEIEGMPIRTINICEKVDSVVVTLGLSHKDIVERLTDRAFERQKKIETLLSDHNFSIKELQDLENEEEKDKQLWVAVKGNSFGFDFVKEPTWEKLFKKLQRFSEVNIDAKGEIASRTKFHVNAWLKTQKFISSSEDYQWQCKVEKGSPYYQAQRITIFCELKGGSDRLLTVRGETIASEDMMEEAAVAAIRHQLLLSQ